MKFDDIKHLASALELAMFRALNGFYSPQSEYLARALWLWNNLSLSPKAPTPGCICSYYQIYFSPLAV